MLLFNQNGESDLITLTRNNNPKTQGYSGVLGVLKLTDSKGETIQLFTRERPWLPGAKWPYGKPLDSCVKAGDYFLVKLFAPKLNRDEIFLYAPANGVQAYKRDRVSPLERYGCVFTTSDPLTCAEGVIQLGTRISHKNANYELTGCVKAHKIFRAFIDANLEETKMTIEWGKSSFI